MSEDFIAGSEAFRKMLLHATNPVVWPTIEGVFAVFASQNGFIMRDGVIQEVSHEKAAKNKHGTMS